MDIESTRKVLLARHLFELALASTRSANDLHLFSAANLMQDAVEAFLLAIADKTGAAVDSNTKFDKYFALIDERIAPRELPFKSKLLRLNRIRIDSKHYGIQPARDECERIAVTLREFFEEASLMIFGAAFSSISTIDLLQHGESREMMMQAREAFESGALEEAIVFCRKALYLEIEHKFDISHFKDGDSKFNLFSAICKAPQYTKNKDYVENQVLEPTGYIVYDHSSLNELLLTHGVDNVAYWNVWRLTPKVYKTKTGSWIVKREFSKFDETVLKDRAEYILSTTFDVLMSLHKTAEKTRWLEQQKYYLTLNRESVPVYKKADRNSIVVSLTPAGLSKLDTDFYVDGLSGDGVYWHVSHMTDNGKFIYGFVYQDCVGN